MASDRTTYQEVGIVLDTTEEHDHLKGMTVYFDSWLAKKFPITGELDKFVWFVEYKDIVAYEPLPEQPL